MQPYNSLHLLSIATLVFGSIARSVAQWVNGSIAQWLNDGYENHKTNYSASSYVFNFRPVHTIAPEREHAHTPSFEILPNGIIAT